MGTQASWVPRINVSKMIEITPTITAGAYSSNQQLGGIQILPDVVRWDSNTQRGQAQLVEVTLLNKAVGAFPSIEIWFFRSLPTLVSTDHATFDLTDANMLLSLGVVSVNLTTNYSTSSSNMVSTTPIINKMFQLEPVSGVAVTTLYAVAKITNAPTFTSTTDLVFQYNFWVD